MKQIEELIETYEKLKSNLELVLEESILITHLDSYKRDEVAVEIFTLVINDLKNINGETVKGKKVCEYQLAHKAMARTHYTYCWRCGIKLDKPE